MRSSNDSAEPLWTGRRLVLCLFGVALGVSIGSLVMSIPDSTVAARLQALWNPAVRKVMQAGTALGRHNRNLAVSGMKDAAAMVTGKSDEPYVLTLIVDRCERYQAWDLACQYARQLVRHSPTPLNEVRYGGALLGAGRSSEAEPHFEKALSVRAPAAAAPAEDRLAYDVAERDLARSLASRRSFARAEKLAQDALRREVAAGSGWEMVASLNDVLATIYYERARAMQRPQDAELARVYEQNALDVLVGKAAPALAAVVYFHMAAILKAQGQPAASSESYTKAIQSSPEAVKWLEEQAKLHSN